MKNPVLTWLNVLIHPKETFAKEKQNASFPKAMNNFLIAFFIFAVVDVTSRIVNTAFVISAVIQFILILIIVLLVLLLIWQVFLLLSIRLFGGLSPVKEYFYLISLYFIPLCIISSLTERIAPFLALVFRSYSLIFSLVFLFIIFLYSLYLLTLVLKETQGFTTVRAFLAGFSSMLLIALLVFVPIALVLTGLTG